MKTTIRRLRLFINLIIVLTTLASCQFSKSVSTDLITGAHSNGDGISLDKVIIEVNGKDDNRNDYIFGEDVNLVFENVNGLTKIDGKVFPGLSLLILKNEKDTILSSLDLLTNYDVGTDLSQLKLNAKFNIAFPSQKDDKFKVHVNIFDKKGKGTFTYELPFTVKVSNLLTIKNNGLTYSNIYLWNETLKQPVLNKEISADHLFILILDGIGGMKENNGKVFPIMGLEINDKGGNKLISSPNILNSIEAEGIEAKDLKEQVVAKITFNKGFINNPCKLIARLSDKNSSKEITIETELVIK